MRHSVRSLVGAIAAVAVGLWLTTAAVAAPTVSVISLGKSFTGAPNSITATKDGDLWFTADRRVAGGLGGRVIIRMTPSGRIVREYALCRPTYGRALAVPAQLTAAPDGSVWFVLVREGKLARITPGGRVQLFKGPDAPEGLVAGPRRSIWWVEKNSSFAPPQVGHRSATGAGGAFALPGLDNAFGITAGADGNLWVTRNQGVWRVTPSGAAAKFGAGISLPPLHITAGPDGNVWFSELYPNPGDDERLARITPDGTVSEYSAGWPRSWATPRTDRP